MASDMETPRSHEKVFIKISKAKGLIGSKGSQLTAVVRAEFSGNQLGESGKIELDANSGSFIFDFTCTLSINTEDPLALDELAQAPVVLTFIEILPKDRKAKEEKSIILGQSCVDLLPLLKGELSFSVTQSVYPVATPNPSPETSLPEVEIFISIHKQLLSDEQKSECNLMTICVESLFSLPEAWVSNGGNFHYAAAVPVPVSHNKETVVLLPVGAYRGTGEQETTMQRRWSCVPNATGSCVYIPNTEIRGSTYEEEDGDFKGKEDITFRHEVEQQRPRVTWNAERRCFLGGQATASFPQAIAHCRYWPLEVVRVIKDGLPKSKGKDEESSWSYHGIAYLDLAPLLYPGVKKVRGAYLIHPYRDADCVERIKRKGVVTDDLVRSIIGINRSSSSLGQTKAPAGLKAKGDAKVKASTINAKTEVAYEDQVKDVDVLGQQFVEARSYVVLEIELDKPLVSKKEPEAILQRIAELVPPRPLFPKQTGGAKKAICDFQMQVGTVANQLLEELRLMFGPHLGADGSSVEERRQRFLYELNTTGKYYAYKERLKHYVVKLVREKFMYKKKFEDKTQLQEFASELFPFLLDQMNIGLNKFLSTEEMVEVPPPVADVTMLKHFAVEAQTLSLFQVATKYYEERILRDRNKPEHWLDFGTFCLLVNDTQKAEECLHEVLAIDQTHLEGLLLNGCMNSIEERNDLAEEFLEAAASFHSSSVLAWVLLGLHQASIENSIMSERSFNEANKQNDIERKVRRGKSSKAENQDEGRQSLSASAKDGNPAVEEGTRLGPVDEGDSVHSESRKDSDDDIESSNIDENSSSEDADSIFLLAARYCIDNHVLKMAERALAHELISPVRSPEHRYQFLSARYHVARKDYEGALEALAIALQIKHENPEAWALKGHIFYETGRFSEAKECYERCLVYKESPVELHPIYLRLANIYLEHDQQYEQAKNTFILASKVGPSCMTWLGVGTACYKLKQLSDAELALNEANILDNKNATVWTYLTLVCLDTGRLLEAERCYKYAVMLGMQDASLLDEVKSAMIRSGFDMSVL